MKNQRLGCVLAGIAIFGLTGCSPESITLEGKVSNLSGNTIVYRPTMDGIYNATQRDTLFLQADSTYRITLPSKGNEKISFYIYGQKYLGTIYAEPGKNVLNIDASLENNLSIENTLVKENEIVKELSRLQEEVFNLRARRGDAFQVAKDTVASSVYQKLTDYASGIEQKITGVDDVFKKRAVQDVRMQILLAFMNQYFGINYQGTEETKKEWEAVYPEMLAYADISQPENVFSEAFADLISNVAGIELYMKTKQQPKDRNEGKQKLFDWYKNNLKGRVQEVAMANVILEDASNESYTTGIPAKYEQIKELHPGSTLTPALEKAIQKNIAFNNQELPEDIHILNTDSVRSFKEITDRYAGKVIFIDIWATWCGPCKKEMPAMKALEAEYKDNKDIVFMGISVDASKNIQKWKDFVIKEQLPGVQLFAGDMAGPALSKPYKITGIPRFMLVGKDGSLLYMDAPRPSSSEIRAVLNDAVKK